MMTLDDLLSYFEGVIEDLGSEEAGKVEIVTSDRKNRTVPLKIADIELNMDKNHLFIGKLK